jgi:hypothetical protein
MRSVAGVGDGAVDRACLQRLPKSNRRHPSQRDAGCRISLLDRPRCHETVASPSPVRRVSCNGLIAVLKWIRERPEGIAPAGRSTRGFDHFAPGRISKRLTAARRRVVGRTQFHAAFRGAVTSRPRRCGKILSEGCWYQNGSRRYQARVGGQAKVGGRSLGRKMTPISSRTPLRRRRGPLTQGLPRLRFVGKSVSIFWTRWGSLDV